MNRKIAWGIVPLALAGLTTAAFAEGRAVDPGKSSYQRFNGGPAVSPLPKSTAPVEKAKSKTLDEDKKPNDTAAALRAQEESNLLRRLAVCDKIKAIALETGDSKLEEQAVVLETRANEVYRARIANLPAGKMTSKLEGDKP